MYEECHLVLWVVQEGNSLQHLGEEGGGTLNKDGQQHCGPALSLLGQLLCRFFTDHTALCGVPCTGDVVTKVVQVELETRIHKDTVSMVLWIVGCLLLARARPIQESVHALEILRFFITCRAFNTPRLVQPSNALQTLFTMHFCMSLLIRMDCLPWKVRCHGRQQLLCHRWNCRRMCCLT